MLIIHVSHVAKARSAVLQGRFDERGGTIGRAADCTLVLPDPDKHISRVQAEVRCANGQYVLLNRSAVNPLSLNGREIPVDESRPIAHDDEITVGQFAMRVELAGQRDPAGGAHVEDPFADLIPKTVLEQASPRARAAADGSASRATAAGALGGRSAPAFIPEDAFSDLEQFAPTPKPEREGRAIAAPATSHDQRARDAAAMPSARASAPPFADAPDPFADPIAPKRGTDDPLGLAMPTDSLGLAASAQSHESIDDLFGLGGGANDPLGAGSPLADPALRHASVNDQAGAMPDQVAEIHASMKLPKLQALKPSVPANQVYRSWENPEEISKTQVVANKASAPMPLNAQSLASMADSAANAHKMDFEPTPRTRTTAMLDELNRQAMSAARGAASPVADGSSAVSAGGSVESDFQLLKAFLLGAGLSELPRVSGNANARPLDAATMQRIGELLRLLSQGTVELLAARAMAKKEMRAEVTVIVAKNNNPLKFSPDAGSALVHLLAARAPRGFMDAPAAVRDAFNDLSAHQIGFFAGMRAAMQGLISRFEPSVLEKRLKQRSMLDKMLPMNRKAKLWELFNELFGDLAREAEDDFETLFGREFLRAYEAQVDELESKGPS